MEPVKRSLQTDPNQAPAKAYKVEPLVLALELLDSPLPEIVEDLTLTITAVEALKLAETASDPHQKFKYYAHAASRGNEEGLYQKGVCLQQGTGVAANGQEAVICFLEAANGKHFKAMGRLAECLRQGNGIDMDLKAAKQWYEEATTYDYPPAWNNLGIMYSKGEGIDPDEKKAYECYLKSATLGNAVGMYNVGIRLKNGKGVKKNLTESRKWLEQASERGLPLATQALKRLNQ
ncbi:MAG: tetratricopeptide repeat protein [Parachlamydiales bacterium]